MKIDENPVYFPTQIIPWDNWIMHPNIINAASWDLVTNLGLPAAEDPTNKKKINSVKQTAT